MADVRKWTWYYALRSRKYMDLHNWEPNFAQGWLETRYALLPFERDQDLQELVEVKWIGPALANPYMASAYEKERNTGQFNWAVWYIELDQATSQWGQWVRYQPGPLSTPGWMR